MSVSIKEIYSLLLKQFDRKQSISINIMKKSDIASYQS